MAEKLKISPTKSLELVLTLEGQWRSEEKEQSPWAQARQNERARAM